MSLSASSDRGRRSSSLIGLDDDVMDPDEAWAGEIRRERHIGDFRGWQKHDEYTQAFARLMRDLKAASESAAVR